MVAAFKTPVIQQSKQLPNRKSNSYTQLEIYSYILESRTPTLKELCDRLPNYNPPKINKTKKPRRIILDSERAYPKDWTNIARTFKEEKNYTCQICGLQCLRPEDNREHFTPSQIGKLTANTHHKKRQHL